MASPEGRQIDLIWEQQLNSVPQSLENEERNRYAFLGLVNKLGEILPPEPPEYEYLVIDRPFRTIGETLRERPLEDCEKKEFIRLASQLSGKHRDKISMDDAYDLITDFAENLLSLSLDATSDNNTGG